MESLRPYVTLTVLECIAKDPQDEIARLRGRLETLISSGRGATREIIAATHDGDGEAGALQGTGRGADADAHALAFVERSEPTWVKDSGLIDVNHSLALWFSHDRFVAIRADGFLADALQRWLDRNPRPMYRRIPPGILEGEVFAGEVRNLWLRGVHPRRRTMADTKYMSGPGLQDALSPLTDASFALGAGRAELALDGSRPDDKSVIGCAPNKSTFWFKQTSSFDEFVAIASSILRLVAAAVAQGPSASPLPWLATRLADLEGVEGAYALVASSADEVAVSTGSSDDARAAAALLEDAELHVQPGRRSTADFLIEVGLNGHVGGTLKCSVSCPDGKIRMAFGYNGEPSDPTIVRPVLEALEYTELLTVYYESGHAVTGEAVWSSRLAESGFPEWKWLDFAQHDVTMEKPGAGQPDDVRRLTGSPGDRSLFSWAAAYFGSGYLTCDDGSGEVADFVHLDHDDTLSLVHIKAASSSSSRRRIAVQRFEVVVGQAVKNVPYLDPANLAAALGRPKVTGHACWLDGVRVADRTEMLDYLSLRSPRAPKRVVVVQPHVTKAAYETSGASASMPVRLLDTLLNSARGSIAGVGAELEVWGALA